MGKSKSKRRLGSVPPPVGYKALRSSNQIWNSLGLNTAWSVGMVSRLIKNQKFSYYNSWEDHYFRSGFERSRIILSRYKDSEFELNFIPLNYKSLSENHSREIQQLQFNYGRVPSILLNRALILKSGLKQQNIDIPLNDSFDIVKYRVLGETWNGIYIREHNLSTELIERYPNFVFRSSSGAVDYDFAVDLEIYQKGVLRCAIQVKPKSYAGGQDYIVKAKQKNAQKNLLYENKYSVKVLTILCDEQGDILQDESFNRLDVLLKGG